MRESYPLSVFADEFKDKRVLGTGGTKGVGEAIVHRFQLSGAAVAVVARSSLPYSPNFKRLFGDPLLVKFQS